MIFLSLRHLLSRKKQTLLILLGITLGTTAYVAISGMMLGFQDYIIDRLVNNDAHIRISAREELITKDDMEGIFYPDLEEKKSTILWSIPPSGRRDSKSIENPKYWFDKFAKSTEVLAYSPQLTAQVLYKRGDLTITGRMIGSKPELEMRVSNISNYMLVGKFQDVGETGNRLVMGSGLIERLGARVGENIMVSSSSGSLVPFKIVGSFSLGIGTIDNTTSFGSLLDVQKLEKSANRISDIGVKLFDVNLAEPMAQNWKQFSRDKIQSWEEVNQATLSVFDIQTITRNFMTVSIVVVASFGIYNILSIMVAQKRKEIAILRALGFGRREIVKLFLYQGLILGIIGGFLGLIIGYFICVYMSTLTVGSGRMMGSTGKMLVSFDVFIYVKAIVIAFISALVSSFLPAYGAGKLTPIEIIRSES